jgi:AmmeMemoRadiSam system protein B
VNESLKRTGLFEVMDKEVDENEHSLEMHLPFLHHTLSSKTNGVWKLLPIVVGQLDGDLETRIANVLQDVFQDPKTIVVVSSDFCHWGTRFRYAPYSPDKAIYTYIEELDREGMTWIEQMDHREFLKYLNSTRNTICGRNPILLLLKMIELSGKSQFRVEFVAYDQSSQVTHPNDSSVSYASAGIFAL